MNRRIRLFLGIAILLAAQLACNMPDNNAPAKATQLPAPNQTLTALFAFNTTRTPTATLPPVITATQASQPVATQTLTQAPEPTKTNTPRPTETDAPPEPTATVSYIRPRAHVVAKYLSTPPTLDGDWGEWKSLTTEYPANSVVFGKSNWTGEDDLSSSFHVGWDNDYLYIGVKVHDDKYVQNSTGENIFKGDEVEILFDTNLKGDFFVDRLSPDDFQIGMAPGRPDPSGETEAYLWFPTELTGKRSQIKIGSRLEDGVYRMEAAIPWSVLEMTPANGRHYGFALSVSDNDNPDKNVQQSMVSNVSGRMLTDPTTWGDLLLQK
jgi:hypothetical protein